MAVEWPADEYQAIEIIGLFRHCTVASNVSRTKSSRPELQLAMGVAPILIPFGPRTLLAVQWASEKPRFTVQRVIDLLKIPSCSTPVRWLLLDHLGSRFGRSFPDVWAFVQFAREQKLGLDFTTPVKPVNSFDFVAAQL
jgi:hypothetical protein